MFRTWDAISIVIDYTCLDPMPADDLGIGIAIERERDLMLVAQFGTTNPSGHEERDAQTGTMLTPPHRKGRFVVDLPEQQLLEGDYLISLGLLPNISGHVEFYEYRHRVYRIRIIPAGYRSGSVFYPYVRYANQALVGCK